MIDDLLMASARDRWGVW